VPVVFSIRFWLSLTRSLAATLWSRSSSQLAALALTVVVALLVFCPASRNVAGP